jgi:hypothetical protein
MLKRWATTMNGHVAKKTVTKRGADKWTALGKGEGLPMKTERLAECRRCGIHGCSGDCD